MTAISTPRQGPDRTRAAGRVALVLGVLLLVGSPILPWVVGHAVLGYARDHAGPPAEFAQAASGESVHVPRAMTVAVTASPGDRTTDVNHIRPGCAVTGPQGAVDYSPNEGHVWSEMSGSPDTLGTFRAGTAGEYRLTCETYSRVILSDDARRGSGLGLVGVLLPFVLIPVMGLLGLVLTVLGAKRLSATRRAA